MLKSEIPVKLRAVCGMLLHDKHRGRRGEGWYRTRFGCDREIAFGAIRTDLQADNLWFRHWRVTLPDVA